jgi:type VI secretion system secreted protein Hcp
MAEMFLKLHDVDGESLDSEHPSEIEIEQWGWTTENHVRWDLNQGGQSTKVDVHAINLDKHVDKASAVLYQCCVTGKHIPWGKITCRKNDGDQKVEYLVVDLKDIMVSKVSWTGNGGEQSLNESLELSFAEFKLNYKLQADSGDPAGWAQFGFNIQRQKAV